MGSPFRNVTSAVMRVPAYTVSSTVRPATFSSVATLKSKGKDPSSSPDPACVPRQGGIKMKCSH